MVRQISRLAILALTTLMGLVTASQVMANDYQHINSLARKIDNKSRQLLNETRHYRGTPNYVRIVRDVAELDQLACHLRDIARNEGDLDHMAADIAKMDRKFHRIENLFDSTERAASYGQGAIQGCTAHVKRLLHDIEDAIHHIREDIEHLRSIPPVLIGPNAEPGNCNASNRAPVAPPVETYRVPHNSHHFYKRSYNPYGGWKMHSSNHLHPFFNPGRHANHSEQQFSIGGGSSRITFRF